MKLRKRILLLSIVVLIAAAVCRSDRLEADTGTCGGASITLPFADVLSGNVFFCAIAEAYFSGLTNGTTPTTYGPSNQVPREQMAAFVTRTMDQTIKRGSTRAALNQFWTIQTANNLATTLIGMSPQLVESDGTDVWVGNYNSDTVSRVSGSDGMLLGTWTGAAKPVGILCAMGKVFVVGNTSPGALYQIDPTQPPGAVATLTSSLGNASAGIGFDGQKIWVANVSGAVSIVTINPITVTNVTAGITSPHGIAYDGANIWVTDEATNQIKKLDSNGSVLLAVDIGDAPNFPVCDGTNIWIPNGNSHSVSVVRAIGAQSGTVIATLTGNGLNNPQQAAFDGERILVTSDQRVSLWRASDLTPIGNFDTGLDSHAFGVCSDGLNFWIVLNGFNRVARF